MHSVVEERAFYGHKLACQELDGLLAGNGASDGGHAVQFGASPPHHLRDGILQGPATGGREPRLFQ